MDQIRWGVLGAAKIGFEKVIPAMQQGRYTRVEAVASRSEEKGRAMAGKLNIPKVYGDYESLLADPEIDAVYIPLPNHLHVAWSIKALEAGKHVLCEKPIGLNAAEAKSLLDASRRHPDLKIMEAFMYRHHPQWQAAKRLVADGGVGELCTIQSFFSYFNIDGGNIRNIAEVGGGGLMDIGCYCISLARFLFGSEPERVCAAREIDPKFKTDRIFNGTMDFGNGTSQFTCSTQLEPYQRVNILGTKGRIEIMIPFNAPPDQPCIIAYQQGGTVKEIQFEVCDQYTIQGDLMSKAILDDTDPPTPLEDAWLNMIALDALRESAEKGGWVSSG